MTSAPSSRKMNYSSNCVRPAGESTRAQASGNAFDADFHGDGNARAVHAVARGFRDFVGDVLALDDFAEDGVAVIEVRRRRDGDEKLAAVGVRAGVGHGGLSALGMAG